MNMPLPGQTTLDFDSEPRKVVINDEQRVWGYIRSHAFGRDNAVKRLEIAEKFGLDVREVSEIVKRLIEKRGKLIGSDSAGYWIPKDMDESKRATQNIRKRFISLAVRLKKLHNWSDEEFSDQLLLALKEKEGHRE